MREIKFQGKCKVTGEWVQGCLLQTEHDGTFIIESAEAANNYGDGTDLYATLFHPVHEESVGAYTGLKDRHECEIYEGHITKDDNGDVYFLYYDEDFACFMFKNVDTVLTFESFSDLLDRDVDFLEIIGNCYENPELLER